MAHEDVKLEPGKWGLLTSSDVTSARVQNLSASRVLVQATNGTTEPASPDGSVAYDASLGQVTTLADDYPGVSGANRLWGFSWPGGTVSVSY